MSEIFPIPEAPNRVAADTYLLGLSPLFGATAAIEQVCSEYRSHFRNSGSVGSASQRAADILARSDLTFRAVAARLMRLGIDVDPSCWRSVNPTYRRNATLAHRGPTVTNA